MMACRGKGEGVRVKCCHAGGKERVLVLHPVCWGNGNVSVTCWHAGCNETVLEFLDDKRGPKRGC